MLVIAALSLPQLLFALQDYYNMQNVIADTAMRNAISGKKPEDVNK